MQCEKMDFSFYRCEQPYCTQFFTKASRLASYIYDRKKQALEFHIRYSPLLVMVVVLAIVAHALAALIHARAVETLQNSTADAPPKLVQGRAAKVARP